VVGFFQIGNKSRFFWLYDLTEMLEQSAIQIDLINPGYIDLVTEMSMEGHPQYLADGLSGFCV